MVPDLDVDLISEGDELSCGRHVLQVLKLGGCSHRLKVVLLDKEGHKVLIDVEEVHFVFEGECLQIFLV